MTIFLTFHYRFMMSVHMEVHSKGYFLMRIRSKFEAGCIIYAFGVELFPFLIQKGPKNQCIFTRIELFPLWIVYGKNC